VLHFTQVPHGFQSAPPRIKGEWLLYWSGCLAQHVKVYEVTEPNVIPAYSGVLGVPGQCRQRPIGMQPHLLPPSSPTPNSTHTHRHLHTRTHTDARLVMHGKEAPVSPPLAHASRLATFVNLPCLPGRDAAGLSRTEEPIFPVMVDVNAGNEQTRRALRFMVEGGYFNRMATKRTQVCPCVCVTACALVVLFATWKL